MRCVAGANRAKLSVPDVVILMSTLNKQKDKLQLEAIKPPNDSIIPGFTVRQG